MSSGWEASECPECGVGVKVQLDADQDLTLSELTEADIQQGEFFLCPMCQIAWDADEREPYNLPTMSPDPSGLISKVTTGKAVSNPSTSHYRLLGYSNDGNLMLRDVGDLAFARDDSPVPADRAKLGNQLGDVIEVVGSGYPKSIQDILNALRPGYCLQATTGESDTKGSIVFDATEPCEIVEAVPVDYAIEVDFIPSFADEIWHEEFDDSPSGSQIPQARRTLHAKGGPAADVYVFPMGLRDEQGVPLLAGMQRGMTHHLEMFTTNFTGVFTGGVIDVLFIAPKNRPYFAVYCLGADCLDLSHELRAELQLPVVHRGREANRNRIFDIRYNPQYVTRSTEAGKDVLVAANGEDAKIDIESGEVEGEYFEVNPEPHELVVTVTDAGKTVEVARLRAPSARIGSE